MRRIILAEFGAWNTRVVKITTEVLDSQRKNFPKYFYCGFVVERVSSLAFLKRPVKTVRNCSIRRK